MYIYIYMYVKTTYPRHDEWIVHKSGATTCITPLV